jgi:hypothetical protein
MRGGRSDEVLDRLNTNFFFFSVVKQTKRKKRNVRAK